MTVNPIPTRLSSLTLEDLSQTEGMPAILPIGSTEQHGPCLPYCTDATIAEGLALRLAAVLPAVVYPTIQYGYRSNPKSGGGALFPGTIDLSGSTVIALVRDVLLELIADGRRNILIVNAHFENDPFITEGMCLAMEAAGSGANVQCIQTNWWDGLTPETINACFDAGDFPGWALEHGGVTETSLMLALAPELVRTERIPSSGLEFVPPAYLRFPLKKGDVPIEGNLSTAVGSTAEKGELILKDAVESIYRACEKEFDAAWPFAIAMHN